MKKILVNPEHGAPIRDFEINEDGFTGIVTIPVGKTIELPAVAADILLDIYGFLEEDSTATPDEIEEEEEVAKVVSLDGTSVTVQEEAPKEEKAEVAETTEVAKAEEAPKEEPKNEDPNVEVDGHECGVCEKICKSKMGLMAHMRSHNKKD